jgi:hypothetical protein
MHRPSSLALPSLLLVLATGCGDPGAWEQVSEQQDDIINGTVPPDGSLQAQGVVRLVFNPGGAGGTASCSGTLVSNQFVLTARHCVRLWANNAWGNAHTNLSALLEGPGGADQTVAAAAVMEPTTTNGPVAWDYALIRLATPMAVGSQSNQLYNPIYTGTDASLQNQNVTCMGYGNNTLATAGPPPQAQTGAGTLRTAVMTISGTGSSILSMVPNGSNQIPTAGDSGSTCFFGTQLTGISSTCQGTGIDVNGNGQIACNELTSVTGSNYVAPGAYRTWVNSRIRTNLTLEAYTFSPPLPAGTTVNVHLTNINGLDRNLNAAVNSTILSATLRSGWVRADVTNEPAGTLCGTAIATAPATGSSFITGACLGDGVMANLYSTVL